MKIIFNEETLCPENAGPTVATKQKCQLSNWSEWSPCSKPCGGGEKTKTRQVVKEAVNGGRSSDEWSNVAWEYHQSNLRMRARSGHVWVVTVDNCKPTEIRCSSPSGVINAQGEWVCQVPSQGEQFFCYSIIDPS